MLPHITPVNVQLIAKTVRLVEEMDCYFRHMKPPFFWRLRMRLLNYLNTYSYLDSWLKSLHRDENFFFAQIGANDGQRNDPINTYVRKYGWSGILIEPQPKVFDALVKNYSDQKGLIFENIAVGETDGEIELFSIDEGESDEWHNLIATVRPEVGILKDQHKKNSKSKGACFNLRLTICQAQDYKS